MKSLIRHSFLAIALFAAVCCSSPVVDRSSLSYETNETDSLWQYRSILRPYHFEKVVDTPAPAGYEPFYIAHYGRHGSRYVERETSYQAMVKPLEDAHSKGLLTQEGERLLSDIHAYGRISDGMYGQISELGAFEHRMLADRMAARFEKVFTQNGASHVGCVPSQYSRCEISMAYFLLELKDNFPRLDFYMVAGDKYNRYINNAFQVGPINEATLQNTKDEMKERFDLDRFSSMVFTNPKKAQRRYNLYDVCEQLFVAGAIHECLPEGCPDLFQWLSPEEIRLQYSFMNNRLYARHCNSNEFRAQRQPQCYGLVCDILDKADAAIEGNGTVADLRFGHDAALMVLMSIILGENYSAYGPWVNSVELWSSAEMIPMASNLQMVLYRKGSSDDLLVKVLWNEKEYEVPGLEAVKGPYYRWDDFEARLNGIIGR